MSGFLALTTPFHSPPLPLIKCRCINSVRYCVTRYRCMTTRTPRRNHNTQGGTNITTAVICEGARIKHVNQTLGFTSDSFWSQTSETFAYLSPAYTELFYVFNVIPLFLLLLSFISPMYKGFEYYHHANPRIQVTVHHCDHQGEGAGGTEGEEGGDIRSYYINMERKLAAQGVQSVIVRAM